MLFFRTSILLIVFLVLIGSQFGCYYDNKEDLFNIPEEPDTCLVNQVSFVNDLMPILNMKCNSCHNAAVRQGDIVLDTYDDITKHIGNQKLMGVMKQENGFSPMPPSGKLKICEIALFEKWIEEGALDN